MTLWQTPGCLVMMVLLDSINDVWTLAAPGSVTMESVDMTHTLTWIPPQTPCNTTILYSVQFQGEFELMFLNGSWVDAANCQRVPHTHCDLTFDLVSDSDYNIQVRAQCGSEASAWSQLSPTFNRRHSKIKVVLTSQMVLSSSTEDQFVTIPAKDAQWRTPTTVTVTVIIMSGLLFVVFWSIVHCQPRRCQAYFTKEPLPQSLQHVQDVQILINPEETELCERVHMVPSDKD